MAVIINGKYVNNIKRTNIGHRRRRLIRRDCVKSKQEKPYKGSNNGIDNDQSDQGISSGEDETSKTHKKGFENKKGSRNSSEGQPSPSDSSEKPKASSKSSKSSSSSPSSNEQFDGALTYYTPDNGACENGDYTESDMVAALNKEQYGDTSSVSEYCNKCAMVTGDKGTAKVKIIDACETCAYGALDVSKSAYDKITSDNADVIKITWTWTDC
ncbi:hypothetical protein FB639_004270 [Coemansia asiatica]|nr:hypothetical protein FB639_004270 [Coemansia asiatica]